MNPRRTALLLLALPCWPGRALAQTTAALADARAVLLRPLSTFAVQQPPAVVRAQAGSFAGEGALVGGVGGALMGLGLAASADCETRCWIAAPAVFAILGTFAGAVLGGSVPRWTELDERQALHPRLRVAPMTEVRVEVSTAMVRGRATRLSGDSLVLTRWVGTTLRGTVYDSTSLPIAAIEHVWVRSGSKTRKGSAIGGVLGAAFGLSLALASVGDDVRGSDVARVAIPTFGLLGIIVGGWVGSGSPTWEPYPWPSR